MRQKSWLNADGQNGLDSIVDVAEPSGSLLRVSLLGGFRVAREDLAEPISEWQRRSAKTLTKLLATSPGHSMHREQVMELLWPESNLESARNSLGKALHAARRAFQPGMAPRQRSPYLLMVDSMIMLDCDLVVVDADRFERAAQDALRRREIAALESALGVYKGDLLPEDRYADWCTPRRESLSELRVRLLLDLAGLLESRGAYNDAADHLRAVLQQDPTREDVHRRLMRLYAEMGTPDQAVRQFHACEESLQRELGFAPQEETVAIYHDVLAHRVAEREPIWSAEPAAPSPADPHLDALGDPFVGRADSVTEVREQLTGPGQRGGMVVISGEAGVGKTRFIEEVARSLSDQEAVVLWGGSGTPATHFACGPFALALEGYVAGRPIRERQELARRYPSLARLVPSLVAEARAPRATGHEDDPLDVVPAIARLLTDIAHDQPALVILGDLAEADAWSLDIISYLAHLAGDRRWLLVGEVREEEVEPGTRIARLLSTCARQGLCRIVELECLSRAQCDWLAGALWPTAAGNRRLLDEIYELTRGNPMFVREFVAEMRSPDADGDDGDDGGAPPPAAMIAERVSRRVRTVAEARLASLDATARRVLLLAAAADGSEVSLSDLRAGAAALDPPVGEGPLLDALDRALELRLLEERSDGYAFRHPLVRCALYGRLSRHRRAQLGNALHHPAAG